MRLNEVYWCLSGYMKGARQALGRRSNARQSARRNARQKTPAVDRVQIGQTAAENKRISAS